MLLEVRAVPAFFKNGFLLGCEETREAVLIDPGDEIDDMLDEIRRRKLHVGFVLLTHGHVDHVSGVARAKRALGAAVALHPEDRPLYEHAVDQGRFFGFEVEPPPPPDYLLEAGEVIRFGRYEARVHHTPGHSPGGVCLQVGPSGEPGHQLFVGDTLFKGSIGRTDLPGGDYATLIRSIKTVLFSFGDEARVHPGHGPATTIGDERRSNPFLS